MTISMLFLFLRFTETWLASYLLCDTIYCFHKLSYLHVSSMETSFFPIADFICRFCFNEVAELAYFNLDIVFEK